MPLRATGYSDSSYLSLSEAISGTDCLAAAQGGLQDYQMRCQYSFYVPCDVHSYYSTFSCLSMHVRSGCSRSFRLEARFTADNKSYYGRRSTLLKTWRLGLSSSRAVTATNQTRMSMRLAFPTRCRSSSSCSCGSKEHPGLFYIAEH